MERELMDEEKGIYDRDLGKEQSSVKESALKVNRVNEERRDGASVRLQGQGTLQVQQPPPPPQGTLVCWERFLHVRSIRVLLVENDDSTRHVVTALLRNCNYEVLEAANGLQAWRILEDLTNHIDLVLTEVVMPCLSGVGLLCKIMSHKTRNNVPVIMMSSHDSRGLVFKCLSNGAVDFLVKPIRKNELKNLWQHVWRRCHSSSGSGSESGTPTQKSVKSKSNDKSDNNSGSNDGSNSFNVGDGSDDGSGAQSSWTKQAVEVYSSQAMSPRDQKAECLDSTCAQFIRSNAEISGTKRVLTSVTGEGDEEKQPDIVAKGKDQETVVPRNSESHSENPVKAPFEVIGAEQKTMSEADCIMSSKRIHEGQANSTGECLFSKHKVVSDKKSNPRTVSKESKSTREVANMLDINSDATADSKEQHLGLRLKRLRGFQDTGRTVQDDRSVLLCSKQSAFSRYNTSSNVFKAPTGGVTASSSIVDNSVEVAKRESVCNIRPQSIEHLPCQISNGVGNKNIDIGSSTTKLSTHPPIVKDKFKAASIINGLHPSSAFRSVKNDLRCTQQQVSLVMTHDMQPTADLAPVRGLHQEFQMEHTHHYHQHHHHHHFHNLEHPSPNHDESSLKKLTADFSHSGSSNLLSRPMGDNTRTYSLNKSALGSNHGSTGQIGSSTAVNAVGTIAESDVGEAGKSGSGDASGNGSGNRTEENKLARREAALTKFLQKRKGRSFKKKARYKNRKRLAEQRPCVQGLCSTNMA
ncbi:Two-component response regulator-like APRR7 [Forsythia ovata]|uniref:Two-component response regulator-like APRR7 n=1 Tax=Forsythia ovata TaxID=205694 RepID=A0ABD1T9G2_9LAMI